MSNLRSLRNSRRLTVLVDDSGSVNEFELTLVAVEVDVFAALLE